MMILTIKIHLFLNLIILVWYVGATKSNSDPNQRSLSIINLGLVMLIGWIVFLKITFRNNDDN
jgi:hypothetical protein